MADEKGHFNRRKIGEALAAGLIGAVAEGAYREVAARAQKALGSPERLSLDIFECWAPLRRGRLYVRVLPTVDVHIVKLTVLEVIAYASGPIPCKAMLEVRVNQIVDEMKEQSLSIVVDWSQAAWGRFGRVRRYL